MAFHMTIYLHLKNVHPVHTGALSPPTVSVGGVGLFEAKLYRYEDYAWIREYMDISLWKPPGRLIVRSGGGSCPTEKNLTFCMAVTAYSMSSNYASPHVSHMI
jgi:hypothetical protein